MLFRSCTVRVSQSSRCLAEPGSLLGSLLLLLVLESLSDANVILHQLVLLDVGGVVLLNWDRGRERIRQDVVWTHVQVPCVRSLGRVM